MNSIIFNSVKCLTTVLVLFILPSCTPKVLSSSDIAAANPMELANFVRQAVERGDTVSANTFYNELINKNAATEQHRPDVLRKKVVIGMHQFEVIAVAGYPYKNDIRKHTTQYGTTTYWHYPSYEKYSLISFGNNSRVDYFSEN